MNICPEICSAPPSRLVSNDRRWIFYTQTLKKSFYCMNPYSQFMESYKVLEDRFRRCSLYYAVAELTKLGNVHYHVIAHISDPKCFEKELKYLKRKLGNHDWKPIKEDVLDLTRTWNYIHKSIHETQERIGSFAGHGDEVNSMMTTCRRILLPDGVTYSEPRDIPRCLIGQTLMDMFVVRHPK